MKVPFDVTFHPNAPSPDIRNDSPRCCVEGWRDLSLVLTGVCQSLTPLKDTLSFSVVVRQSEMRSVRIQNPTGGHWQLRPVIEGGFWSGPETLAVEPLQTRNYELTYRPLQMTAENKKHQGSLFMALPDGSGLLYSLLGCAEAPRPVARLSRDLPVRTAYTELLEVRGWLSRPQRFRVARELVRPDKADCGAVLRGLDWLEVPAGGGSRSYKLGFTAQREGLSQIKVTFTDDEAGGEYVFWELSMRTNRPHSGGGCLQQLRSPVRQTLQHSVSLENPGSAPVTFTAVCLAPDVQCPTQMLVLPQTKVPFMLEYTPLRVGESQAKLELSCPETGPIVYELELVGTETRPERPLQFRCALGSSQTQLARFRNHTKVKADFSCKIEGGGRFVTDKSIAVAPSAEAHLEVQFEPAQLGPDSGSRLVLSSPTGGDFMFPLSGTAELPRPQGPFTVRSGSSTTLTFRNPLPEPPRLFLLHLDAPAGFHLARTSETLRPRREIRIPVGYEAASASAGASAPVPASASGPLTGKLVISCPEADHELGQSVQWVFYLRGVAKD